MRFIEQAVAGGGLCTLLFIIGCDDVGGLMVEKRGIMPTADARVLGQSETDVTLTFTGQPVAVTLDGSSSNDPDGHIVTYRWLASTGAQTTTDGGVDGGTVWNRTVPDGESAGWPDDVVQPTVMLGEWTYVFTLWVTDDSENTSTPASVKITVSAPLDPGFTAQCVASAAEMTDPRCVECMCGVSDACREAVSESKCDNTCWALLGCIGTMFRTLRLAWRACRRTARCSYLQRLPMRPWKELAGSATWARTASEHRATRRAAACPCHELCVQVRAEK